MQKMVRIFIVVSFLSGLIGFQSNTATAGEPVAANTSLGDFPEDLWDDGLALFNQENLWWLLGGAAMTLGVHEIEDPDGAARFLNKGIIDEFSDSGNIWGDIKVQAPLALVTWGLGGATDKPEIAELGYDLSRSLLLTYGTVSVLKIGIQRTRPNGDDYSFPSGHTAAAFSTAGVVSQRYGGWAGGVAIGLGVLTGMGRMEDMKHFASDVVAGATIGWIIGRNSVRNTARDDASDQTSWRLVPSIGGVAVAGRF